MEKIVQFYALVSIKFPVQEEELKATFSPDFSFLLSQR